MSASNIRRNSIAAIPAGVEILRALAGFTSPLRAVTGTQLDWVIVRENSEGEYAGIGGRAHRGHPREVATEVAVVTRAGIERIMRTALALARSRPCRLLTVVTKSNAQRHGLVIWDDILSDLAAALAGSPGIAPTANLNPKRTFPSMFEPIHGLAFDIAGQGVANPIGTFWSASLMLEHLGEAAAAALHLTDPGGTATTVQVTCAGCAAIATCA